jgi:MFS family permease
MIWVPMSVKFGKRAVLITSMAMLFAALCWGASATTFNSLLAARCISGFASAAGEVCLQALVFLNVLASV